MAIGDGSFLKKNFPRIFERIRKKRLEKAKKKAKNPNTSMEKRSKELDMQIKGSKFATKGRVRKLKAEKAQIDRRRKYDKSSAGDAQMKIDDLVRERTKLRKRLKEIGPIDKAPVSGSMSRKNRADKNAIERQLKDIQSTINQLSRKAKIKKTVS